MHRKATFAIALAFVLASSGCGPGETPYPSPDPNPGPTSPTNPTNPTTPSNPDPGVSDPTDPGPSDPPTDPQNPQQNPQQSPQDPPPQNNCPVLSGTYSGTLGGKLTGFPSGDVDGTISFKVDSELSPGTYQVSGQQQSWLKGMELFKTTQPFTGQIKCGKLGGSGSTTIFGVKTSGSVDGSCSADGSGCNGTWKGKADDNSSSGSGTFQVKRQ